MASGFPFSEEDNLNLDFGDGSTSLSILKLSNCILYMGKFYGP